MENSVVLLKKIKNRIIKSSSNSTSVYIPQKIERNVYTPISKRSNNLSVNLLWMDKQNVLEPYNGIYLVLKKGREFWNMLHFV
jgi:hypothetical protein